MSAWIQTTFSQLRKQIVWSPMPRLAGARKENPSAGRGGDAGVPFRPPREGWIIAGRRGVPFGAPNEASSQQKPSGSIRSWSQGRKTGSPFASTSQHDAPATIIHATKMTTPMASPILEPVLPLNLPPILARATHWGKGCPLRASRRQIVERLEARPVPFRGDAHG